MAQNKNFIGEADLIYNVYIGDQNATTINKVGEELKALSEIQRKKGKKVLIITDISQIKKIPLSARIAGLELIKNLDFDKTAIWGSPRVEQEAANFVIKASGKATQIRLFTTEQEAKDWLL